MGFYFRKSIHFGPFRINLSKSGVGVSAGVKGARISSGSSGNFIHLGSHGVYYKQRIGGLSEGRPKVGRARDPSYSAAVAPDAPGMDVERLVDSSSEQLLAGINDRVRKRSYSASVGAVIASGATLTLLASLLLPESAMTACALIAGAFVLAGIIVGFMIEDDANKTRRVDILEYKLDGPAMERFARINTGSEALARSNTIWLVSWIRPANWKMTGGASTVLDRMPITVGPMQAPYL